MIIVRTQAYNAEKTLDRAITSILNQTYRHFKYYIIDNGSDDRTSEIIAGYAKKDGRIRALRNEINSVEARKRGLKVLWTVKEVLKLAQQEYPKGKYYCVLDADDEYLPEFFEKALEFIDTHSLDIAACGWRHLSEETGKPIGQDISVPRDIILQNDGFAKHISEYRNFTLAVWGKMYSLPIAYENYVNYAKQALLSHMNLGTDTISVTKMFAYADRVGIMSAKLHIQYMSPTSISSLHQPYMIKHYKPHIHHKVFSDFLRHKGGRIKPRNKELFNYYFFYSLDMFKYSLILEIPISEKASYSTCIACTYIKSVSFWGLLVTFKKVVAELCRRLFRKNSKPKSPK